MKTDKAVSDPLVPDPVVCKEFGITRMTLHRWDRDEKLGFPIKIQIREKNYRRRDELDAFKRRVLEEAIATRGKKARGK
ncbi:hypothetical protein [Bradyrhizobium sp. RDT46]|uniref:hypothetical protein n=1 Tax=Bradyrhizobium sp. RDT46 TaxID=3341829 RepID=UPI0035C68D54